MENWGLITYREYLLLVDRSTSRIYEQQRIADVIAHELAHMVSELVGLLREGLRFFRMGMRYFSSELAHKVSGRVHMVGEEGFR